MKEQGLYYPDGSFRTDKDIKKKIAREDLPLFETPLAERKSFTDYWSPRFIQRQEEYQSAQEQTTNHVTISFPDSILLNFIGDTHVGGDCDYRRLEQEVRSIIETPNSYVMVLGDLIDGFFFNEAQMAEIEQAPEQIKYVRSLLSYLGENHKLLIGWKGDHDRWHDKMGHSMYSDFAEFTHAYLMKGVGYATLKVGSQEYKLTGAHRLPGSSIYNKNHPQKRALVFGGAYGSDIVVSAHNHQKGYSIETLTGFGNEEHKVHQIALGAYKCQDDYSQKLGFAKQTPSQLFGSSVRLDSQEHSIRYWDDVLQAHREF